MIRDVKEIQQSTLWEDTGRQIMNKSKSVPLDLKKTIVFIVGERFSGKTSFLKIVKNDFDPDTKPNALVEYQCTKIGRQKKHLVHFYQLGSQSLLPFLSSFTKKGVNLVVLLCVDLSKGKNLVSQTANTLKQIREVVKSTQNIDNQIRQQHEDSEHINSMPVRMALVGCKWDIFEKLDLESKKWITRSLRYLAHTHCASVICCSNKINTLGLNIRGAFVQFFLGEPSNTSKNKDYNKPLFIRFGEDSIAEMKLPTSGSMTNIEVLEKQLQSLIPHETKAKQRQRRQGQQIEDNGSKLGETLRAKRKQLSRFLKKPIAQSKQEIDEM